MITHLHVFTARFETLQEALLYAEEQWEPEPPDDAPEAIIDAWEERNPTWAMQDDLGDPYLDPDCIETIWVDDHPGGRVDWDYLATWLGPADVEACRARTDPAANTLITMTPEALGGFPFTLRSTARLTYCGCFPVARGW